MNRIHLFEFEDQRWFPGFLRNYMTDFLQFLSNKTKMYKPVVPLLAEALNKGNSHQIVDLGSGGGGGLLWLNSELKQRMPQLRILLTDFYPNLRALKHTASQAGNITFVDQPVDARQVPENLEGLRTQFLSLHHFRPDDATRILQNAVDAGKPIAIVEAQERSVPSFLAMFFSPITVIFTTPFIRPFSWGRLIFTYLIPLVPIFVWWDGMVSSLRTYSVREMEGLVARLKNADQYDWNIGKMKSGPGVILHIIGTRK